MKVINLAEYKKELKRRRQIMPKEVFTIEVVILILTVVLIIFGGPNK